MSRHSDRELARPPAQTGCLGLIVRVIWMLFGNAALVLLAVHIVRAGSFSAVDALFWLVVAVMVGVRYVDITWLGGLTAEGEPASLRHWRRYSASLLAAAAGLYVLAYTLAGLVV
jgi:hypothetical protein